jgi:hypothetical protein
MDKIFGFSIHQLPRNGYSRSCILISWDLYNYWIFESSFKTRRFCILAHGFCWFWVFADRVLDSERNTDYNPPLERVLDCPRLAINCNSFRQGIIALTYAKVILTKLDGDQNSSSFVLYILENWNKSLRNIRNSPKKCLTLMQRHGLRRDLNSGPNNPIHTACF